MTVPPPPGPPDGSPAPAALVTYATGSWAALVLDDLAALFDLPPDSRVLAQCWSAAANGQGLDGVLGVVGPHGPQPVANYAAVARTAEGTRVVVAGSARAEVGGTLVSTDGGSVRDERIGGHPPVRLAAGTGAGADPAVLPLLRGIAPAGAIGVGVAAGAIHAPAAVPAQEAPVDPMPVPRVSSNTMPPASVYDSGIIESLPWRGTGEEPAPVAAAPPPPPPAPPVPPALPSRGDPFAGGEATGADPHPHTPWGPPPPAWPPPPPAAPAAPPQQFEPPVNPWAPSSEVPSAPPEFAPPPPPGAPAGETSGPVVHAFACPRGHLNPPYAGTCRICEEPIPPQEGFAAPRPSLGVLTLSTGDTVPLDRDVVLGRAPFHADESAVSRPHLVQLASPGNDISRSHVRVNLENWFVQVTDLGSTNGTVVTLPDQAPVRLRPHDPFTILPGTTVNIADEVTLRYEVS